MSKKSTISGSKTVSTPTEIKPIDDNLRKWDLALKISFSVMIADFFLITFFFMFVEHEERFTSFMFTIMILFILSLFSTTILSILNLIKNNKKVFVIVTLVLSLIVITALLLYVFVVRALSHLINSIG